MPDPIVFISHATVKEGMFEAFKELSLEVFPAMEAEKPGTMMHYGYSDDAKGELHFVHVFPDADAFDAHMVGAGERTDKAYEAVETYGFEIYGTPSEETLAMLKMAPGIQVVVKPVGFGGYIRLGNG